MSNCKFCQIVTGFRPSLQVFEDPTSIAFLDHRPLFHGHLLLIPKEHYETLADLPANLIGPLFSNAQLLSCAVERAMRAEGTFLAINNRVSQSIPHLHIHIVPRRRKDGLRGFFWPRRNYRDQAEAERIRDLIRDSVSHMLGQPS
jgi:histidine triad (HIT) family protein